MAFTETQQPPAPAPAATETITVPVPAPAAPAPAVTPPRGPDGKFLPAGANGFAQGATDGATYTAADLDRIRTELEEKLRNERIAPLEQELNTFRESQRQAEAAAEAARLAAEEATRKDREEAMSARELLEQIRTETAQQVAELQRSLQERDAILDKERQYSALSEYRSAKVAEAGDKLMPHLIPFVTGNSQDEIDRSLSTLIATSDQILNDLAASQQQQRQAMPGVSMTGAPPIGPIEHQQTTRTFTPEQIRDMPMEEYAQYRTQFTPALARQRQGLYS